VRITHVMKTVCAAVASLVLLAGTLLGDAQTGWVPTSTNREIQYRSQVFDNSKACYLEFRDQQQGASSTTFDVAVDCTSTDLDADQKPLMKTETEHIVTTPTHTGGSRISNCSGVVAARVSPPQRR
jgi:hypothetical protein